jgi:hypothetical protein
MVEFALPSPRPADADMPETLLKQLGWLVERRNSYARRFPRLRGEDPNDESGHTLDDVLLFREGRRKKAAKQGPPGNRVLTLVAHPIPFQSENARRRLQQDENYQRKKDSALSTCRGWDMKLCRVLGIGGEGVAALFKARGPDGQVRNVVAKTFLGKDEEESYSHEKTFLEVFACPVAQSARLTWSTAIQRVKSHRSSVGGSAEKVMGLREGGQGPCAVSRVS